MTGVQTCALPICFPVTIGGGIRWRDDGIAPTASVGMPVAENGVLEYDGDLNKIRFIQQSMNAVLNVVYYA